VYIHKTNGTQSNDSGWSIPAEGLSVENVFQASQEGKDWAQKLVNETID